MLLDNIQKALVRLPGFNIGLRILKYPDQADIVIITGQIRLNILKIPYMNRYIAGLHMAVCIDSAPLPGQIDAGHFPGLTRQSPRDRTAARPDLQHLVIAANRQPLHDILPQPRQMIQHRPAPALLDDPLILHLGIITRNL